VFRNSQLLERIEVSAGIPLGLMEDGDYSETQFSLQAQDLLVLYSDGVSEARDINAKEFEEEGLIQALTGKQALTSHQAIQGIKGAMNTFVGRAPQHDDITIMTLKVL